MSAWLAPQIDWGWSAWCEVAALKKEIADLERRIDKLEHVRTKRIRKSKS